MAESSSNCKIHHQTQLKTGWQCPLHYNYDWFWIQPQHQKWKWFTQHWENGRNTTTTVQKIRISILTRKSISIDTNWQWYTWRRTHFPSTCWIGRRYQLKFFVGISGYTDITLRTNTFVRIRLWWLVAIQSRYHKQYRYSLALKLRIDQ